MAYKSFRDFYKRVKKIPAELKAAFQKIKANNQNRIIELLMRNSAEAIVGAYRRNDRQVHFKKAQTWELEGKFLLTNAAPQISIISAISSLNAFLKKNNLPYAVWQECRTGNPRHSPNATGKRAHREKTSFKVGLVDKRQLRQPKKPPV